MTEHLTDEQLLAILEGDAGSDREHLDTCEACANALRRMRVASQALNADALAVTVDAGRPARLQAAVRRVATPSRLRRSGRDAAVLAAGILIGVLGMGMRGPREVVVPVAITQLASRPSPFQNGSRYILLLRGAEPRAADVSRDSLSRRYRAYGDWAQDMSREHRLIQAAKLGEDAGREVSAAGVTVPDNFALAGYFVIWARDYDDAVSWARRSPHIAYGGDVVVRRID